VRIKLHLFKNQNHFLKISVKTVSAFLFSVILFCKGKAGKPENRNFKNVYKKVAFFVLQQNVFCCMIKMLVFERKEITDRRSRNTDEISVPGVLISCMAEMKLTGIS
jgi:hypothetical protein